MWLSTRQKSSLHMNNDVPSWIGPLHQVSLVAVWTSQWHWGRIYSSSTPRHPPPPPFHLPNAHHWNVLQTSWPWPLHERNSSPLYDGVSVMTMTHCGTSEISGWMRCHSGARHPCHPWRRAGRCGGDPWRRTRKRCLWRTWRSSGEQGLGSGYEIVWRGTGWTWPWRASRSDVWTCWTRPLHWRDRQHTSANAHHERLQGKVACEL